MEAQNQVGGALIAAIVLIIPAWRIFRRAGLHPALSLLLFLPGLGFLIVALVLAFSRWPAVEGVTSGSAPSEG